MFLADFLDVARQVVSSVVEFVAIPVLVYFFVTNTSLMLLIGVAAWGFGRQQRRKDFAGRDETMTSQLLQGVSIVVPSYNEEAVIVMSVQAMLSLEYPRHEVIVVDDGSTDKMFEKLQVAFDLVRVERELPSDIPTRGTFIDVHIPRNGRTRLVVVRKENSGKTDSVSFGINAAVEPLVVCVDADSILDPSALIVVTKPFADDPIRVVATGGVIRAANGCKVVDGRIVEVNLAKHWLVRIQAVEYLRAFLFGRAGWSGFRALILISGAFAVFRRDILVEVGGLDPDSIGEDFEIVMRIHKYMIDNHRDYRVQFVAEPVSWTEVPISARVLRVQRKRWHRGLWETLWKYRGMLFNPRYGRVGMLALPYFWLLELIAPLLELAGLVVIALGIVLGVVSTKYVLLVMAVAYGYAILVTLFALAMEE
ncbi:MAG: glycosyltransferase family 2 protein, partial [Ilumatobacteraceae bacterium]